jgi:hypothetical protein
MKEDASAAVDALEPRQTKITARLNAQGAMLDELQAVVMAYLHLLTPRPDALPGIYEGLLESAQNAERKAIVIGGA